MQAAFHTLPSATSRWIYKKTDSLLRGNIGAELRALREAAGSGPLVFAPAYPTGGRTTVDGIHRLDGVPVAEAAPGQDPLTPVRESHIPSLLLDSAGLTTEWVALDVVRGDRDGLVDALRRAQGAGVDVVAPDVETDGDLGAIALALRVAEAGRVCAGSAGLAEYLARVGSGLNPARGPGTIGVRGRRGGNAERAYQGAGGARARWRDSARRMRIGCGADIEAAVRETLP